LNTLVDTFERRFSYLRLSVTDRCNFRCAYCLPHGSVKSLAEEPALSTEEIRRLVEGFAAMGLWKVRITGGEPTLRRDIVELVEMVSSVAGVRRVALSTNGYRLIELAGALREAGLVALNVSVDTLDRERFRAITGHDLLGRVLDGIEVARSLGLSVKINAVLRREMTESELDEFFAWARRESVSIRFIELMPTADNRAYFEAQHLSSSRLQAKLVAEGWRRLPREEGAGPAVDFAHPGARGRIGLIAPYAPQFCSSCNRLRVSSHGRLRLCLFGEGGYSLRPWLSSDDQKDAFCDTVRRLLQDKKSSHFLHDGLVGDTANFAQIGG
jgi:cyclic pyranopterin phosphate synthase